MELKQQEILGLAMEINEIDDCDKLQSLSYQFEQNGEYEKAFLFMEKAALKGDALAQYYLATYYEKGQGVEQNYMKAAELYEKVSECREALVFADPFMPLTPQCDVEYILGKFHEKGLLPNSSEKKSIEWYLKGVSDGSAAANLEMAKRYFEGRGVEQNDEKAIHYLFKAVYGYLSSNLYKEAFNLCAELLQKETSNRDLLVRIFEELRGKGLGNG